MILTCPNCQSRFRAPDAVIGAKGHKVKCSQCDEIWFQEPDTSLVDNLLGAVAEDKDPFEDFDFDRILEDEMAEEKPPEIEEELSINDILVSHAEDIDFSYGAPSGYKAPVTDEGKKANKQAFRAAAAIFFVTLGMLLMMGKTMMSNFPATYAFYKVFGYSFDLPGEGLIFDKVTVTKNQDTFKVTGVIQNMSKKEQVVPLVEAALRSKDGKILDQWRIALSQDHVNGESSMDFETILQLRDIKTIATDAKVEDADNIFLRFILASKTDAEDGGNNQAPRQGVQTRQSDDATDQESPQPSSSEPHQESSHQSH